jgi:CheY-like chemotaxis protein
VVAVASGAEALEAVPTFQPDVLDMLMPGLSGSDVLDALRRAAVTVPVISARHESSRKASSGY